MTRISTPSMIVLLITVGPLFAQDQESSLRSRGSDQKVLFFDGIGDYAKAPFLDFNEFTDGFTVEAWHMNWTGYILSQGAYGPENSVWLSTGHGFFDGCGWENERESLDENFAQYVGLFRPGKWTHVAMVFDGKKQMVFVDGQLIGERLSPAPGVLDEKCDLIIGAESGPNEEDSWNFGSGFLRSLRVSSVARYSSEFKPAATLESDDETVVLYSSTSVKGDQLVDRSGNERHGKLHWANNCYSALVPGQNMSPWGSPGGRPGGPVYASLSASRRSFLPAPLSITERPAMYGRLQRFPVDHKSSTRGSVLSGPVHQ